MTSSRIGLFIIRAWVEGGSVEPLRAHVSITGDVSKGIERTRTVAKVSEVAGLVDTWLNELLDASPSSRQTDNA